MLFIIQIIKNFIQEKLIFYLNFIDKLITENPYILFRDFEVYKYISKEYFIISYLIITNITNIYMVCFYIKKGIDYLRQNTELILNTFYYLSEIKNLCNEYFNFFYIKIFLLFFLVFIFKKKIISTLQFLDNIASNNPNWLYKEFNLFNLCSLNNFILFHFLFTFSLSVPYIVSTNIIDDILKVKDFFFLKKEFNNINFLDSINTQQSILNIKIQSNLPLFSIESYSPFNFKNENFIISEELNTIHESNNMQQKLKSEDNTNIQKIIGPSLFFLRIIIFFSFGV